MTDEYIIKAPIGSLFFWEAGYSTDVSNLYQKTDAATVTLVACIRDDKDQINRSLGIMQHLLTPNWAGATDVTDDFKNSQTTAAVQISCIEPPCWCNRDDFTHADDCQYAIWNRKRFGRLE